MVTTKHQWIKKNQTISACANIGRNIGTISKIPIGDIENFVISAADILPIRYIGTPLTFNVSRIVDLKSFDIYYMSCPHSPYKLLPPNKNI